MSDISDALEAEVAAIRAVTAKAAGRVASMRERSAIDRHFTRLMRLIAPRIRHFTRAYGLLDLADDAAQACAIALHRAIAAYDPAKARFTTFINWQLRGELQALRFRSRSDSREPARRLGAVTLSLDALREGDAAAGAWFEDADAVERTEALAAETMARRTCGRLLDDHAAGLRAMALRHPERRRSPRSSECIKPGTFNPDELGKFEVRIARERAIAMAHLLGEEEDVLPADGLNPEQRRQIARRTLRALSDRARGNPRFDPDALALEMPVPSRH